MTLTITISDKLYARLVAIAEIAGTGINNIAESGIESEIQALEVYHEVEK